MTTDTTTLGAIRENIEAIVLALTPTTRPESPYRRYRGDMDFREYAQGSTSGAVREFDVRRPPGDDVDTPEVSDAVIELTTARLELLIAYPRLWAWASSADAPDLGGMEDVIDEDRRQIAVSRSGIGVQALGSLIPVQQTSRVAHSIEEVGKVFISVFRIEVTFAQAVMA